MKIAIAGAGAMGSRFGYMLHRTGQEVLLLDQWQDHLDRLNRDGLKVTENGNELRFHIPACRPEDAAGNFELILVFTKAMQMESMMKSVSHLIGGETRILTLSNGLGNIDVLEQFVPKGRLYAGVTIWTSELIGPGEIEATGAGTVSLQQIEKTDDGFSEELLEVMNRAGLSASLSSDVLRSVWHKAAFNGVFNAYCAILNCRVCDFGKIGEIDRIIEPVVDEFMAVGLAEQVAVDREAILSMIHQAFDPKVCGEHAPSMVQDLNRKRPTEIDYLNGAVARLGEKHGIPTPYCRLMTDLIHGREFLLGIR